VPSIAVTVLGANGGKDKPARLEALQARATPSDAIVGAVSPTMLSPGGRRPLQHHAAGSALSRRLVGDPAALWSLLAHLGRRIGTAGGRSAPVAWYVAQAADAQAMMLAMVDVAVGTCG
jgi:hypothetical protein